MLSNVECHIGTLKALLPHQHFGPPLLDVLPVPGPEQEERGQHGGHRREADDLPPGRPARIVPLVAVYRKWGQILV